MRITRLGAIAAFMIALGGAHAGQDRLIQLGAAGQGGLVRAVETFNADANLLYAAILGAGIYKSTDAGATWAPKNNGLTHLDVWTIRPKPGSTTTLYVATDGGEGFYKSTDGGETWLASNNGMECRFARNIQVASTAGHLVLATTCGAFRSVDEGATWSRICPNDNIFHTVNIGRITADGTGISLYTSAGIYFSEDSGATCSSGMEGLQGPAGAPPSVLDARGTSYGVVSAVAGNGLFVLPQGSSTWAPATGIPAGAPPIGSFGQIGSMNLWAAFDGVGIYKTTDGGETWAPDATLIGLPGHFRYFISGPGGVWWAATYAGVYKSTDSGANWTKASTGLPHGHVVNVSGPSSLTELYAQGETIYKTTDGGETWVASDNGIDGKLTHRTTGIIAVGASTVYASTLNYGLYKSTDAGATWFPINNGLPTNLASSPVTFRPAPSNPDIGYAFFGSGKGAFRTDNGGANWTDITAGLPMGPARNTLNPAIHPTNPDIVYLPTRAGLYKTTDGGTSWQLRSPGGGGFVIHRAEIDPGDPQTVLAVNWVSDGLDRALSTSGMYLTRDGGFTWRQLVANEKIPHARLVRSPLGGRTDAYVISRGHFNDIGYDTFKCMDITAQDFDADLQCSVIPKGEGQGIPWSMGVSGGRAGILASTTGIFKQRFLFLGPDFNNDGRADIFWRNAANGQNWLWLMNGTGFFGRDAQDMSGVGAIRTVGSPWFVAGLGDFDGNGKTDILWRNSATGENYIYLMDGFDIIGEGYIRTVADQNWQVAGIGDFGSYQPADMDNDARSDILWRHAVTGENYIFMMNGLEIAPTEGYIRTVADPNWAVAAVGDFDGDAIADILWRNTSTGENYLYPMVGKSVKASEGFLRTVAGPWMIAGVGDFNQDDRMDVVWRNPSTGENYVYPMDGTTILPSEGYLPTVPDSDWAIAGLGDYDGGNDLSGPRGISDILWRHTSGSNYLWRMGGPTAVTSMCGDLGCTNGYLPSINAAGFEVVNK